MSDPLLPMRDYSAEKLGGIDPRQRPLVRRVGGKLQMFSSVTLHLLLILAHVGLVIVYIHHYEHRVTVETGHPANRLSTIITVISQTIGTVYSAVLVLLTQQLALRRDFHVRQTLSALHDKSTAWLGLGSSVLALWGQLRVRTAPIRLLLISAYLGAIFVFHITTPSLFNVVPYNVTVIHNKPTQLARVVPLTAQNLATNDAHHYFPQSIYSILELLPLYPGMDTPGLLNSTLYDSIPLLEGAVESVAVNASQFQVDCGAVPNGSINKLLTFSDAETNPDVFTNVSIGNSAFIVGSLPVAIPSLITLGIQYGDSQTFPTFVVASSVPIVDASGATQSLHPINPPVIGGHRNTSILYGEVQLLSCNVALKNATVHVSAATGKLEKEPYSPPNDKWHDWSQPDPTEDPMLSIVSGITGDPIRSSQQFCVWAGNSSMVMPVQTCYTSSLFESFVQSFLAPAPAHRQPTGVAQPNLELSDPLPTGSVKLADLNQYLANAFAAVFWYTRNVNVSRLSGQAGQPVVQSFVGEATIQTATIRSRLNLNALPLYIGLGASGALFILSLILMGRPRATVLHPGLSDTTGLLQLTWIVGQDPVIAERVADTDEPTDDNLRRAGMFEVNMGEAVPEGLVRRKTASTLHRLDRED